MAKRGRRSIRNKRKSVKKYSSKRRSKTMRYLRGGVFTEDKYTNGSRPVTSSSTPLSFNVIHEDSDQGGGRRRYYKRKQSKTRKH
jgi:hypothetical protein